MSGKNWKDMCKKIFTKEQNLEREQQDFHKTYRLLLLGTKEAGKTTVMKQMKILYGTGFCEPERRPFTKDVLSYVRESIQMFLASSPTIRLENQASSRYLDYLKRQEPEGLVPNGNMSDNPVAASTTSLRNYEIPPQYWNAVENLWNDKGFQDAVLRSPSLCTMDSARYFLDRVGTIRQSDYVPSEQDVLRLRIQSTVSMETVFAIDHIRYQENAIVQASAMFDLSCVLDDTGSITPILGMLGYFFLGRSENYEIALKCRSPIVYDELMFDVAGQRQGGKWLQCFSNITAIFFVVPMSAYNIEIEPQEEDGPKNRLEDSLQVFTLLWNSKWLTRKSVILFLNKMDQLQEKIISGDARLETFFPEFAHYVTPSFAVTSSSDDPEVVRAKYFIRNEIMKITTASNTQHVCYPHFTTAIDTENIRRVFTDCRDIIQVSQMQQTNVM